MLRTCLTALLLTLFSFVGLAQDVRVTLSLDRVPMRRVINEIENQTHYLFATDEGVDVSRNVTVRVKTQPLSAALDQMIRGTDLQWKIEGAHIYLFRRQPAQPRMVTGAIVDQGRLPVPGAAVTVRGTTTGAVTNPDGQFELLIPGDLLGGSLEFSSIGYETVVLPIGSRSVFDVTLNETAVNLDEAVVVGYGVQKKGSLTGSVASINQNTLKQAPVDNLNNMLGGKLPGLVSRQTSGLPGENEASIYIRGISTTGSSSPLILVDGVERDFSNLDPSEVANITILKDAASAAVYGVKGANGVILVTTRRGDDTKPVLTYNGAVSFSTNADMLDLLNGPEYVYWHNLATDLDGISREYNDQQAAYVQNGGDPQGIFGNTDWKKLIFKNFAFGHNHNLNVTGGNRIVRYFVGGN